jgi:ribonuclease P protein component
MPERDAKPVRWRLPARMRLHGRSAFEHAYAHGTRLSDARLTVWAVLNELEYARLGLAVGRKYGHAVARNRIKRLIREAFRLTQHQLPPGLDLVCSPRLGRDMTLTQAVESLPALARRLAERLPAK